MVIWEMSGYTKTGLHPIMHLVAVRESLAERHPWLCASLYKAFREAKKLAIVDLEKSAPWRCPCHGSGPNWRRRGRCSAMISGPTAWPKTPRISRL